MKNEYSPSIDWAADRYKAVRPTINKAKKLNVEIVTHYVRVTSYGTVYQHCFFVKDETGKVRHWTNQHLSGFLSTWLDAKKRAEKNK